MKTTNVSRLIHLAAIACVAALTIPTPASATPMCVSTDDWRDSSIDFWVRADGALYSLDAGYWLEPDGLSIFDFIVDPTQGIELCFYFEDNRGAARAWDEQDALVATAKASDSPGLGVDCFTVPAGMLGQVLEHVSGQRGIPLTTTYQPPDTIDDQPRMSTPPSTLTLLRTLERSPDTSMALTVSSHGIYWDGVPIDGTEVEVDVDVGSALDLCVSGEARFALQVGDGPITELFFPSCVEVAYAGNGVMDVDVYAWSAEGTQPFGDDGETQLFGHDIDPVPPLSAAKIRIIKSCPLSSW
jgi:hypothetical protein